jgi:prepilin-type N-terminal cleavage/methylation domain-containing protein
MFKQFATDQRGFTLMELLIAVAIVAILAGVSILVYLKF